MAIKDPTEKKSMFVDKQYLRRKAEEMHAALGIQYDPNATVEQARELMLAEGVRPEDNSASREIYRMRYGHDWESNWDE